MASRREGSDRGRPAIDWEQAFLYYAALPSTDRSYRAVAERYRVSVRTVETHGRAERWKVRLERIRADAAASASEEIAVQLTESWTRTLRLTEATLARYAQQLQAGTVKVTPSDLVRLTHLQQQLTDTLEAARARTDTAAVVESPPEDEAARKLELVRALREAGVFDRLNADHDGAVT